MVTLPHLETNITIACQLSCVGCNHYVGMQTGSYMPPEQIERDVNVFSQVAHIEKYALIGGEPLLHRQIVDILGIIRASGVTDWIEVWSNGIRARKMTKQFWSQIDELVVSRYPGKLTDEDVDYMRRKCDEHGKVFTLRDGPAYFTTLLYQRTASDGEAEAVYKQCWYKTYCHVLDNGHFYRCCTTPFVPKLILGLPEGTDGLCLDGITEEKLRTFLAQEETPKSCYRCAAHNGPHIGWRETGRDTWLEESMG